MKTYLAFVILALIAASATAGTIKVSDLDGGYLIARSASGNSHIVQMQLKSMGDDENFLVVSYKEALNDAGPTQECRGNATLEGTVATVDVVCGSNEYVFDVNFQAADTASLKKGAEILVQSRLQNEGWLPYSLTKQDKPYFQ